MSTTKMTPAPGPATAPLPPLRPLAESFDEATREAADAGAATAVASEAEASARAALNVAITADQEKMLPGPREGRVQSPISLEAATDALRKAEAAHRAAAAELSAATNRRDAASAELARSMHSRGTKFARLGDKLIIDVSIYPERISRMGASVYRMGAHGMEAVEDWYYPAPTYAAEIIDLIDVNDL